MPGWMVGLGLSLGPWEDRFVELGDSIGGGSLATAAAVLLALLFGAMHSLAPGHGKAVVGAYLLGHGGHTRDAFAFGVSVAAMHTASVLVAGGLLYLGVTASIGTFLPWMSLASGFLVLLVGAGMLIRQLRLRRGPPVMVGGHGRAHSHGRLHAHGGPSGPARPSSRPGLIVLGLSGGLLPSPSAFLVLATAIFAGKALLGFLLVAAFSVGLAATLTAIGLAAVRGRALVDRWGHHMPRRAGETVPLLGAIGVLSVGLWVTVTTLTEFLRG